MTLWKVAVAMLLGALCSTDAGAAKESKSYDVWLHADITIDKDGHITTLDWTDQQPGRQLIARNVAPRVKAFEFIPAKIDDQPTETRTALSVEVRATEQEDGSVSLQVTDALTGPKTKSMEPPRFPPEGFRSGVNATVSVELEVQPDGQVQILDMQFDSSSGKTGHRTAFVLATEKAVQTWTFQPELVAGHAVKTRMQIPISFCLEPSQWRDCHSVRSGQQTPRPVPNMPIAINSAVALKSDIRKPLVP